jgi:pyruvate/2-oxoglutarate dehydrogenase complex dihydrolipoamide acyltransferase (E2) component
MPTDIIMPQMGESIVEGTITKWLKKPGDKVQRDEPLFEISTDKVDAEIPAPTSGVLQEIKVTEGTTVGVNTVVGTIAAEGEAAAAKPAAPAKSDRSAGAPPPVAETPRPRNETQAPAPPPQAAPAQEEDEEARSSPLVRKIAREHRGSSPAPVSPRSLPGRCRPHDEHAQADRQAHDRVAPHQRARSLYVRSGLHPHRQLARQTQIRI